MRQAEWRGRSDDPKGLIGWWWRDFSAAGWPLYLLMVLAVSVGMIFGSVVISGVALVALILASGVRVATRPDPLGALLPDPAPEGHFRVAVEYRKGGIVTGRDEMALTVVDGWLVGEGVRSHFALRSVDAREARMWDERTDHREKLLLADGMEIRLRGIAFDSAAKRTLDEWRRSEAATGEPTFPPARAHPQEVARWMVNALAPLYMSFLPGILADLFPEFSPGYELVKHGTALIFVAWMLVSGRRWWRLIELDAVAQEEAKSRHSVGERAASLPDDVSFEASEAHLTAERASTPPR